MESSETVANASRRGVTMTRLQLLERRAAAARRRLTVVALLAVTAIALGGCSALALVPWWTIPIPVVILVTVLLLGRRAALSARKADSDWLAERRAARPPAGRTAVREHRSAGRSAPPRVTGRAVHSSQANTQMIPRVTPQAIAAARALTHDTDAASSDAGQPQATVESDQRSSGPAPPVQEPERRPERGPAPWELRPPSDQAWDPVPVPPPTYTMKPSAPQHDTGPSPASIPEPVADVRTMGTALPSAPTPGPRTTQRRNAGDDPRPKTETLGLPLNEILARRRVAGQ